MLLHQPGERRSMLVKMGLLDALRFLRLTIEQALDVGPHPFIDQIEKARGRRIKTIIEVEDPIANL